MLLKGRAYQACLSDGAERCFKSALALAPRNRDVIVWHYAYLTTWKRFAAVLAPEVKESLKAYPGDVALQSILGRCLYASGDKQAGYALMSRARAADLKCSICYENLANSYEDDLDADRAERELSDLVKQQPQSPEPLLLRARIRQRSGNLEGAVSDYSKTIEIHPDCQMAYFGRAHVLFEQELSKKCLNDCSTFLAIDSGLPDEPIEKIVCLKMKAAQKLGLNQEVIEAGRKLTANLTSKRSIAPRIQEALVILAESYRNLKEYDRALETTSMLLRFSPRSSTALLLKANLQAQINRNAEALATFNQLLAIDDSVPDWHRSKAAVLEKLGRSQEAAASLKKAAALDAALR